MGTVITDLQLNVQEVPSALGNLPRWKRHPGCARLPLEHPTSAGYWSGKLEADASVTAGYIPLMFFMHGQLDPDRQRKAVNRS